MATPTNHTTSSLFVFNDMLDLEPSQSSLEQNSSIEESTIFVSRGGEVSGHTRYSSSALSGYSASDNVRAASVNNNVPLESLLGPLKEEPDTPIATAEEVTTTSKKNIADGITSTSSTGILKPPSYLEQQHQQQQQQQQLQQQQLKLTITTESEMVNEAADSVSLGTGIGTGAGSHVPQPFSPTVHTSNQTPRLGMNNAGVKCGDDDDNISRRSNISDDDHSAERVTAWAIHIALIFFCGLAIASVVLTFTVIRNYGFVTLLLMTFVIAFCAFLACFVDSTILSKNPKLRPVRQKILTAVRATRKMLEDEYHLFIHDWNENLLLTQGSENNTRNAMGTEAGHPVGDDNSASSRILPTTPQERRRKSKVFKMIRPFLGLKKKLFRGRGRWQKTQSATGDNIDGVYTSSNQMPSYKPPAV